VPCGPVSARSAPDAVRGILTRERGCRSADTHHEVWGRTIGVKGSDVVDRRLVGSADKSRGPDDHWNDVDRFPDTLVHLHAEIPDELIENQVAAVQRLQHEDLFGCSLSIA